MRVVFLLFISLLIGACSDDPTKSDPYASWTAEDFYDEAKDALAAGEFKAAIENLESLEARFPFSHFAKQAQLDVAYAYYKFEEPESAISSADRFIRLNPRDPHVDYAWYLKGLSNFNRGKGIMDGWFPRNLAHHDTKVLKDAIRDFSTLIRRHPDSQYSADAYQRLIFLRNKLAEHEILVAEYYIKRKAWLAAARRAQYTLEHYQTSPISRRALEIMIQAYTELDLPQLVADTQLVLDTNQPQDMQTADLDEPKLSPPAIN